MSEDIAFMICVSCAGMAGVDQGAYLGASQAVCGEYLKRRQIS